jgi:hypothetical protein
MFMNLPDGLRMNVVLELKEMWKHVSVSMLQ